MPTPKRLRPWDLHGTPNSSRVSTVSNYDFSVEEKQHRFEGITFSPNQSEVYAKRARLSTGNGFGWGSNLHRATTQHKRKCNKRLWGSDHSDSDAPMKRMRGERWGENASNCASVHKPQCGSSRHHTKYNARGMVENSSRVLFSFTASNGSTSRENVCGTNHLLKRLHYERMMRPRSNKTNYEGGFGSPKRDIGDSGYHVSQAGSQMDE